MSKHTPGPWFTAPSGDRNEAWGVYATAQDEYAEEGELTCLTDYVSKADAALIAAAPELLAALTGMVEQFERESPDDIPEYTEPTSNYRKARDAITKAEGRA